MENREKVIRRIFDAYLNAEKRIEIDSCVLNEKIWRFMKKHRLDMIFCDLLSEKENVPSSVQEYYLNIKQKQNRMTNVVYELVNKLRDVQCVFLKGVPLSMLLYREKYHRLYHDIDILVERKTINKIEERLFELGYQYGYEYKGKIYSPSRKEIITKQLYSHECYEMVKIHDNDLISYVDINFLFSWIAPDESRSISGKIVQDIFRENAIKRGDICILSWEYMFVHLCCHFYNEAHFLETDLDYNKERDQNIILIRLMDILLVLNEHMDFEKVKKIVQSIMCENKIGYVLHCVEELLGYNYKWLMDYLGCELNDEIINSYYSSEGKLCYFTNTIAERVYGEID